MPLQRRLLGVGQQRPSENFELNRDSPHARGLVGWWPHFPGVVETSAWRNFGGSGTYDLDVTANGNFAEAISPVAGRGVAYDTGTTPYAQATNIIAENAFPFTVACWGIVPSSGSIANLFWIGATGTGTSYIALSINAADKVRAFIHSGGGGTRSALSSGTTAVGVLFHACAVFESNVSALPYLNGSNARADENTGTPNAHSAYDAMTIGNLADSTPADSGQNFEMFDLRVWDRALSDTEVYNLWQPALRWDLYHTPRIMVPGFVAAVAANPKGPLGHPLHGPLGGPVG